MNKVNSWFGLLIFILALAVQVENVSAQNLPPGFSAENEKLWTEWLERLYEIGVDKHGDSLIISSEAKAIVRSEELREFLYPKEYTWPVAQELMKQMHLKYGFWYLINLYPKSKEYKDAVMSYLVPLDQFFDIEKAMVASFYTMIFFDPEASKLVDNKPVITNPEVMEAKLAIVTEICQTVVANRDANK